MHSAHSLEFPTVKQRAHMSEIGLASFEERSLVFTVGPHLLFLALCVECISSIALGLLGEALVVAFECFVAKTVFLLIAAELA